MTMDDRCYVVQSLFRFLARSGMAYCVVGDTRKFPDIIASDVDIVVDQKAFSGVPQLIARFAREHGVHLVQWIPHERTAIYFVLAWAGKTGGIEFLAVDICGDYLRGGRRLLAAKELLAQREPATDERGSEQGFLVPPAHMQFIYYLVKKVDKRELADGHGDYLSNRWHADVEGAQSQIGRFWPNAHHARLIARAAESNEWSPVRDALPRLRRALHRAAPLSFGGVLGELRRALGRVLRPTGLTVAVLGPDGSGKSSVIDRVLTDLAPAFRRTQYMHLRPRLFGGRRAAPPVTAPHSLPPRGPAASVVKLLFLLVDYIAGYALRVWPMKCRSTLVVFDRYYRDLLIDPIRYRYGGPMRLLRWTARCVPGPDLWVVLDAPGDVLQSRKSEVPAEESERQRQAYLNLAAHLWNGVVVDASPELARVATAAEASILRWLEGRLEFRYPQLQVEQNPLTARLLLFFCRRKTPVLAKLCRIIFNSDIFCRMFSPVILAHPYGIIIHADCVIGRRVTIMQQVTLGTKDRGVNLAPVIEDDVYIGAGAKVLGPVRVGRGTVIGANAVVTRDVPPYSTVVGANRIVQRLERRGPGATEAPRENRTTFRERMRA